MSGIDAIIEAINKGDDDALAAALAAETKAADAAGSSANVIGSKPAQPVKSAPRRPSIMHVIAGLAVLTWMLAFLFAWLIAVARRQP